MMLIIRKLKQFSHSMMQLRPLRTKRASSSGSPARHSQLGKIVWERSLSSQIAKGFAEFTWI